MDGYHRRHGDVRPGDGWFRHDDRCTTPAMDGGMTDARCTTHRWMVPVWLPVLPASRSSSTMALSSRKAKPSLSLTTAAVGSSIPTRTPLTRSRRSLITPSTVYNDETAPTLMAAPMPSLNADGQTISLQFSESIDQSSVYNALQNFKLFVDGVEQTGSFSLESDASGWHELCFLFS